MQLPKRAWFIFIIAIALSISFLFLIRLDKVSAGNLSSVSVSKSGGGYASTNSTAAFSVSFTTATEVPIGGYVGVWFPSGFSTNADGVPDSSLPTNVQIDDADPGSFSLVTAGSGVINGVQFFVKTAGAALSAGSKLSFNIPQVSTPSTCSLYDNGTIHTDNDSDSSNGVLDGGLTAGGRFAIPICTPSVKGRVTNPAESSGIADVNATIHNTNWSTAKWTQSDANGYFYFFEMNEATGMILEVRVPSGSAYSDAANQTVNIPAIASQPVDVGNVPLTNPAIVGKIYKPDGTTALQNAEVSIHNTDWSVSKWAQSNASGVFRVGGLGNGDYTMEFRPPWDSKGLVAPASKTFTYSGSTIYYDGDTNDQNCTGTPCNASIVFQAASKTISGTVKKPDGSAVTNANVEAYKEMGMGWSQVQTDGNGAYTMTVGGGKWMVSPRANYGNDPSSVNWTYNKPPTRASFASNNTTETKTINFTVQLADCSVTGSVVDPDGNALTNPDQNVYVNVWSREGGGNGANVASDGSFTLKVPEGSYGLNVSTWGTNYGSPAMVEFTVKDADSDGSCDGYNAGTIKLLAKNSTISGTVTDSNSVPVSGQQVSAMQFDNPGWASATTGTDGSYSISTTAGTWMVSLMSDPGMMGGGYNEAQTTYIYDGAPLQVTVAEGATSSGNDFEIKIADATINGQVVDSNGSVINDLEMGYAFVETGAGRGGPGPMMFSSIGAPVQNGTFTLKLPAGTYNVGVGIPPGAGYCTGSSASVTVAAGGSATASVTMTAADATISGNLKDGSESGSNLTGVMAEIFGHSGTMNFAMTNVNTSDGSYSMSVCPGDWYIGFWIDPSLGYMNQPPTDNKVTVASGATATKNLVAKQADATISGTVTYPDGTAAGMVWVSVDTRSNNQVGKMGRDEMFMTGSMTDATGSYSISVPSGDKYFLEVHLPPGLGLSYINPDRKSATPGSGKTVTVNLQFKDADATITGTVTQGGSPRMAFVSGWSEDGGYSSTMANSAGVYSLSATTGTNWHVKAMYESGTSFARSNERIVSPSAGSNTLNLDLTNTGTLPDSVSVTFSATNQKTITLSDGTTINIPAGALASSGNVTVTVDPKAQLPNQSLATPIDIGYDIKAFDANGNEITGTFNSNVTIVIPYTDAELTAAGITEDDLVPSYWDSTTSTWKAANNISIDKDNNTVTITINHFTDFALVSAGKPGSTATTTTASTSTTSGGASPPGCGKASPASAPWLYGAIAQGSDSVKLYFTDADGPLDKYVLQFGLKSGDYIFGSDSIGGLGMRTYLVQHLTPNTTYYFRVRAGNDCAIGPWSSEISVKTKPRFYLGTLELVSSELEPVVKKERGIECSTYSIQAGDNLWSIAQKYLEDGARFKEIIELNKEKYPSLADSNVLNVGWELDIDCKPVEVEEGVAEPAGEKRIEGEEEAGYAVKVKVVDTEGKPVAGAKVLLYSEPKEAITDADGIARFTNVEGGYHKVVIAYKNYRGEQSINLTGNVSEFDLTITVKKTMNYPLIILGVGVGILLLLLLLSFLKRTKAERS